MNLFPILMQNFVIKCGMRFDAYMMNWEQQPSMLRTIKLAMTLADRIAILDKGELQQHCAPMEAYHNPANDFVRSFLCKHIDDLVDTANALFKKPEEVRE